ncbi:MAG: DUF4381 domain-containing protein [Pseudomonadota bacterium]
MTPEEILRDLRDIHLPDQVAGATGVGFVLWPALVVVMLALIAIWFAWRRRSTWRREIISHLDTIEDNADQGRVREAWTALAILLRRIAVTLHGKQDVAGLVDDAWLKKLDQLFKTDVFSDGPGRGVTVFPFGGRLEGDGSPSATDQLKTTVDHVRRHLPQLGTGARWS